MAREPLFGCGRPAAVISCRDLARAVCQQLLCKKFFFLNKINTTDTYTTRKNTFKNYLLRLFYNKSTDPIKQDVEVQKQNIGTNETIVIQEKPVTSEYL